MSTRSLIGRQNDDGTVTAIYCHWDGYTSHNGKILHEHYQDEDKITALLALGYLSSLGPEIGEKRNFNDYTPDQCIAYHRDRGDRKVNAIIFDSPDHFWKARHRFNAEYIYLYQNSKWYVQPYDEAIRLVSEVLEQGE